jgi:hypothetical protein
MDISYREEDKTYYCIQKQIWQWLFRFLFGKHLAVHDPKRTGKQSKFAPAFSLSGGNQVIILCEKPTKD